ncbi:PP2C-domain-containing protein [Wallemia mellicola]|nr:PP2C-domain-containing protein [Wallemia mellicola]
MNKEINQDKREAKGARTLYTANVGDARAVLCRAGQAIRLTYDHKGSDDNEQKRIMDAGGYILNGRVNGVLAVTRALGDSPMKQYVVGSPYTTEIDITDDDEWLVIACDGLWDVATDSEVCELIKECKSAPVVDKSYATGEDADFVYAVSEMQGMEDAHTAVLDLNRAHDSHAPESQDAQNAKSFETKESNPTNSKKPAFFAVYDGHGGSNVARYTGATLYARLARSEEFKSGDWHNALINSYLNTDEAIKANPELSSDPSGCTAVSVLITPPEPTATNSSISARKVICANAGDSRAALSLAGQSLPLSYDHKPQNEAESDRIVKAGGFVEIGRVNGNLALSRAIGDFEFKQNPDLGPEAQIVTAVPDIIEHECTGEEEFLILACDGIWDCLSSQQVVDITRRAIANGEELKDICAHIMDKCLAPDSELGGIGCDNMTITIVAILGEKSKDEWRQWVKERVENGIGYSTPESVPDIFERSELPIDRSNDQATFDANRFGNSPLSILSNMAGASGSSLQEALESGGIVFQPSGSVTNKDGQLVYASLSDDSEESDEESNSSQQKIVPIKDGDERQIEASGGLTDTSEDPIKSMNLATSSDKEEKE